MNINTINHNGKVIADITGEKVITDAQSALDVLMSVKYEAGTNCFIIDKAAIAEAFFILSSGLAGEILQKFINYNAKCAIYGDFSKYTSKPLKDFIYESNKGRDFFFMPDRDSALEALEKVM